MESPGCKLPTLPRLLLLGPSLLRVEHCIGLALKIGTGLTKPCSRSRAGESGCLFRSVEVRQRRAAEMNVVLFFHSCSDGDSSECPDGWPLGATELCGRDLTLTAEKELNPLRNDFTVCKNPLPLLLLDPGLDTGAKCNSVNFRLRTSCVAHHSALVHSTFGSFFSFDIDVVLLGVPAST